MSRAAIAGGALVIALVFIFALLAPGPAPERDAEPAAATPTATTSSTPASAEPAAETHPGFIYGRITDVDGATYEGRLRWGGDQEAFWGDYFNGSRDGNPWAVHLPEERSRSPIEIFGIKIGDPPMNLGRQFMARFGDIARIEAQARTARVTLKSGSMFSLNRFEAGDIDDGVRVWDRRRGVVDVDAGDIRTIELLATAPLVAAPNRLHGTVRTRQGDFTGFIQWDGQDGAGADGLTGRTADGERTLTYDTIRSIARQSRDSALVTLRDGSEIVLSDSREVGPGNRGIYVDDGRYGRVLVSWDAFERVEFSPGGSGPAYSDFEPGRPLAGIVTTRAGRRLAGRLVYDLDESETTETLEALLQGVDYNIPFRMITTIVPPGRDGRGDRRARVTLLGGEELQLERSGDFAERNAGMLIFVDGRERPEYVPWTEVGQIELDRTPSGRR